MEFRAPLSNSINIIMYMEFNNIILWIKQDASRKITKNRQQSSLMSFSPYTGGIFERVFAKDQFISWALWKRNLHVCSELTRLSVSWMSLGDGIYKQENDLFHRISWKRLYLLWSQVQEICLPSIQKITMFRLKTIWSLSCVLGCRLARGLNFNRIMNYFAWDCSFSDEFIYDYVKKKL